MLAKFGVLAVGGLLCADAKVIELGDRLGVHSRTDHEAHVAAAGFGGDKMERVYTKYAGLPMGEVALKAAGWTKMAGGCDGKLGYAYTQDANGPTKTEPLIMYVTKGGQPAGAGTIVRPGPGKNGAKGLGAQQAKYASPSLPLWIQNRNVQLIEVAFRSGAIICNGNKDSSKVGTELTLNPRGGTQQNIPITQDGVEADGWRKGACFSGMGWHYFYDMKNSAKTGSMVWHHETVGPLVAMYHEGEINAIFFMVQQDQGTTKFVKANWWEPVALDAGAMCKNACDGEICSKNLSPPGGVWSTMHIYFRDHDKVDCAPKVNNLKCAVSWPLQVNCCAKDAAQFSDEEEEEEEEPADNDTSPWLVGGLAFAGGGLVASAAAAIVTRRAAPQAHATEMS